MNKKFALTVGINNYPGIDSDLRGCVNDAVDWQALLAREGYAVTTLLDEQATRGAIISELTRLVATARFADRIVFTYSGHGTWMPDISGDEADRRDEALVCYDFADGGLLSDDTLQMIFAGMRYGTGSLILSDSCHSGTMTREPGFVDTNVVDKHPRFLSPAVFLDGLSERRAIEMEEAPASAPRRTASLISGCTDLEYSYDASFNGRPNGAFSRMAIDSWYSGVNLKTWHTRIREKLPTDWYPQTPQLTASSYRRYARAL